LRKPRQAGLKPRAASELRAARCLPCPFGEPGSLGEGSTSALKHQVNTLVRSPLGI